MLYFRGEKNSDASGCELVGVAIRNGGEMRDAGEKIKARVEQLKQVEEVCEKGEVQVVILLALG